MEDVLTKEEQEEVARKIDVIRAYEAGDESLVDDVIDIIIEIDDYISYAKKEVKTYKRYLFYYKAAFFFTSNGDIDEKKLLESANSTLSLYFECLEILKRYLKTGNKTDNFPDLEAAYLLTIYLSALLLNVADYFEEINTRKSAISFGYSYANDYLEDKCEERRNMVRTLAAAILPENNVNEKV